MNLYNSVSWLCVFGQDLACLMLLGAPVLFIGAVHSKVCHNVHICTLKTLLYTFGVMTQG